MQFRVEGNTDKLRKALRLQNGLPLWGTGNAAEEGYGPGTAMPRAKGKAWNTFTLNILAYLQESQKTWIT